MPSFRPPLVALLLFLAAPIAVAQITSVTEDQAPPQPGVGHDYIKMLNETVNPATGSVSIRIGVPVPPGRDLTVPFSFGYDSNSAHHIVVSAISNVSLAWTDNESYLALGGWTYGIPVLEFAYQQKRWVQSGSPPQIWACEYFTDYTMTGLDGRSHALYVSETQPTGGSCQYAPDPTPPNPQNYLSGGDGLVEVNMPAMTNGLPTAVSVAGADGMVYYFPNTTTHLSSVQTFESSLPAWIETRNGNKAVFSDLGSGAFRITDTLGRTAISTSGFGASGNTVAVAGLSNPYTASWGTSNSSYTVNATVTNYLNDGHTCASFPTSLGGTQSHVTQVTLPNNTSYQFQYDPNTGLLSRLTYPTGGYVRYVWGSNPSSESMLYPESLSTGPSTGDGCQAIYDTLAVAKRYVSFDGTHEVLEQDFGYSTTWNSGAPKQWTSKTTTVTTKDLARPNTSFETQYTYIPVPAGTQPNDQVVYGESGYPVERQVVYFNDLGVTQLETVTKGWPQNFIDGTGQNFLLCELHSPSSSQIAGAFYGYGGLGVITDKKEYNYGTITSATSACQDSSIASPPSGQARETVINYQSFADTPIYPSSPSLLDRPSSIVIKDGSGNRVAETDYAYDQNAVSGASTPSGTHDETNYSANSSAPRGNATTITKQCFPSCSNAVSTYTYDETGQMLSRTDPCGNASCSDVTGMNHTTAYSYVDSYNSCSGNAPPSGATDAYLTQINYPATNGVSHVVNFCYGYDDGQLRGSSDQNNQMTLYKYNDLLGRLTEIDYPLGQTLISYSDAPLSPTVTTEKLISSGVYLTTVDTLDGMGHQIESQLTSDPQGTTTQSKTVDGLGQEYQVYNPFRSPSDPTYGFTAYAYDALGRTTTVTKQDGSVVSTTYSANCTTVADEAAKSRKSCTDGFGRVTQVFENPSGVNWETDYTYSALDDLTNVVQGGSHSRGFNYDSLRRLTQSANPESGTIQYAYDANGNVASKLAPLPNQMGSSTVTTTYTYDALNRVTGVSFTNGDPSLTYTYDQSGCAGQSPPCYNVGHRTGISDAGGSEFFAFDKMGREIAGQRTTNGLTKTAVYSYDFLDDVTALIYPTGLLVNYTYDTAGRPSTAQDAVSGVYYMKGTCATGGGSSNGVCYAPQGAISQVENGANVFTTYLYNNRLQPCWIFATTGTPLATNTACSASDPGNAVLDLQYCFYVWSNGICQTSTTNNGNVIGVSNNRDTTRSQSFTYDQVNRVVSAQTSGTTGSNCWGEAYSYDQWANLQSIATASGYSGCPNEGTWSATPNANNQLPSLTYDAGGNTLTDGLNLYQWNADGELKLAAGVNYTYSGDGNRLSKSTGETYWYGLGGEILGETDSQGNRTDEYVFFGGKRVAHIAY